MENLTGKIEFFNHKSRKANTFIDDLNIRVKPSVLKKNKTRMKSEVLVKLCSDYIFPTLGNFHKIFFIYTYTYIYIYIYIYKIYVIYIYICIYIYIYKIYM